MICGLVYHHLFEIPGSNHSPRLSMEASTAFVPEFINGFFHLAFMAAVPTLSVISGYLFFNRQTLNFRKQLVGRFYTVALPSWLWSALWLAAAYTLYQLNIASGGFAWVNYGFENPSAMTLINGIFGVTREPLAFQFWFVHDLLITLLLSPLIYLALRWLRAWIFVPLLVCWLLIPSPPFMFSGNVPVFFTIGAFLAMPGNSSLESVLRRLLTHRLGLLCLLSLLLIVRLMAYKFGPAETFIQGHIYLCLLRIVGVAAIASALYALVLKEGQFLDLCLRYSGYSFFVFAAHFPLIELVQAAVVVIPGYSADLGMFISWLTLPFLTIVLCVALAKLTERIAPSVFNVLNGGRQGDTRPVALSAHPA